MLTPATSRALAALVDGTGILILSDEVYEHIIFDGAQHESMARYPELAARSFIVGSFGKTYHVTGWKVGYAVAPAALTAEFRKVHQFVTFSTNTPVQYALADFLADLPRARRAGPVLPAQARSVPSAHGRVAVLGAAEPRQLLPADGLLGDHRRSRRGLRRPPHARARRRVDPDVAVPHTHTAPPVLRFCFAKKDETLERAAERLCKV